MTINRGLLLVGSALALATAPAAAQTVPAGDRATPTSAEPPAGATGEDIVVTAQKREQSLIDVPQSITAITGATLETQQASAFQDYLKLIPGLQLNQATPGFGRLVIRGINTGGVASTVGVYVDETPFGSSSSLANGAILAGDFDTFDIARVEVLRGPQGTLYGASSLSGVLKFVTNAPETDKLVGRARGGVETTQGGALSYYGNAVVNLPLGDTLAFRASGNYRRNGGFIDTPGGSVLNLVGGALAEPARTDINGSRVYGGRAALLFAPGSRFSVKLSAVLQNIDADAPSTVDADPVTLRTLGGTPTQTQFVPSRSTVSYRVYNGLVTGDLGFATVTSSSSYATLKQDFRTDLSFNLSGYIGAALGVPNNLYLAQMTGVKRFTQEVRLASNPGEFLDWLVGGYYTHERGTVTQRYVPVTPGTTTEITALPLLAQVDLSSRYQEYAGFADATLHLGRRFDLEGGLRYSHNDQRADQTQNGALVGGFRVLPTATSSEGVFTWSVAPKFKLDDRATVYARVAKGFRPGGPNVIAPPVGGIPANTPTSFGSDTVTSYEGGIKAQTADRTFALDLAGFHIDWNNIQLFAQVNGFGLTINGVSAQSDGAEFTATFRPTEGLTISANGAYTHARLTGDASPLVGGRRDDDLPFTPPVSIGINGDYRFPVGNGLTAFVGASERFLSKQNGAFDNAYRTTYGHQRRVPSYNVVDLRGGLDFGRFGVEVYARNLANADGKTSTGAPTANSLPVLPNGAIAAGIIRPRTFGASLTASF